jgi:hypothetical protein
MQSERSRVMHRVSKYGNCLCVVGGERSDLKPRTFYITQISRRYSQERRLGRSTSGLDTVETKFLVLAWDLIPVFEPTGYYSIQTTLSGYSKYK